MDNKNVGYIVLGIAILLIGLILLFNSALKEIVRGSCTLAHGDAVLCPMYKTINQQTYLGLGIVGLLVIFGLVLIFSKPNEKLVIQEKTIRVKVPEKKKKLDLNGLENNEKRIVEIIQENGNAMFQADLMEKMEMGKVGMTRLLDKLEAKQFIERKRRGMNNIVVLKN